MIPTENIKTYEDKKQSIKKKIYIIRRPKSQPFQVGWLE